MSSAGLLLSLALMCSMAGTAVETFDHGADHDTRNSIMTSVLRIHEIIHLHQDNDDVNPKLSRTKHFSRISFDNDNKHTVIQNKENNIDKIYNVNEDLQNHNLMLHKMHVDSLKSSDMNFNRGNNLRHFGFENKYNTYKRIKRQDIYEKCSAFNYNKDHNQITHPTSKSIGDTYERNIDCVTVINGTEGTIIQLTFVDIFHIEDHPDCDYDYLEIRDGIHGYARLLGKFCGEAFPNQVRSTGPSIWLKFHSDDTIEYEGFHININITASQTSHSIPESCFMNLDTSMHGVIDSSEIPSDCKTRSIHALDVLWTINTPENTKIYLNFTTYRLAKPNECEDNFVQVFGSVLEYRKRLAHYCGSMANAVSTKTEENDKKLKTNIMHVRLYASKAAIGSEFKATYTAYRTLDTNKDETCTDKEFDCTDNTCIAIELKCDGYAHCRLKTDEGAELCKGETESILSNTHILVILIIFSLILSGMCFVFLFKCIMKLYKDHKIIKEHIRQSCEDRLDSLVSSRLTLDAKRLERDSEPRASLERENHTNEMFKRQRNLSQHKPTSIDSDFIQETQLDLDEEPWRREVENVAIETEEVRIERNGRRRDSEKSKKSTRRDSRRKEARDREEHMGEKKDIKDASVGVPDTKESGCQTRESLFQVGASSPEGTDSGSGSRGFSTFGYSGATIARPSPPAAAPTTATSHITIELLQNVPSKHDTQTKKIPDRRPMSTETTRSAPDVIIVSKPVR